MLYNQWCSVVRWEKTTRPFAHRRVLWREGHTIHETAEEAKEETRRTLEVYTTFCEDYLAIPVIRAIKPSEKSLPAPSSPSPSSHDARWQGAAKRHQPLLATVSPRL